MVMKAMRNAFIVGAFITFVGITIHFLSGNYIGERLDGTWRAVCIQDEITFDGASFTRGQETGKFRVRANLICFCESCIGYPIRVTERYLMLNGIYYLRSSSSSHSFSGYGN
jgi:hypothetical protein